MEVSDYLVALGLTIIIEIGVAALFGYHSRIAIRTIVLINLITHPAFCYFLWVNSYARLVEVTLLSLMVMEVLIALVEWLLLLFVFRKNAMTLFVLSFTMNLASFVTGLIVFSAWGKPVVQF